MSRVYRLLPSCSAGSRSLPRSGTSLPWSGLYESVELCGKRSFSFMPQPANQNRSLVTAIPGPKSQALRQREDEHIAPGAQGYALAAGIVVDTASGTTVTD